MGRAGNVMDNAATLPYFVLYYTLILALCVAMFQRVRVLKVPPPPHLTSSIIQVPHRSRSQPPKKPHASLTNFLFC